MSEQTCKIEACGNKIRARGWCGKHYQRWRNHGHPEGGGAYREQHGMDGTSIYRTWEHIKTRCDNKNARMYERYGGRGIKVCQKWRDSFTAFYEDMGDKPTPKHQLDRIDNDGDYEPNNCRWVTAAENAQNRSSTKLNAEKVRRIRERCARGDGTQTAIAKAFGVARRSIGRIVNGIAWKSAPGPIKGVDYQ